MRRILVLIFVCSFLIPSKKTLADSVKGILIPNEGWITTCMQEITHGLLDPCSQSPVPQYFLEAEEIDPSYLGHYVAVAGTNVGLTCFILLVESIELLGDPEIDTEGDGIKDLCDNCPSTPNGSNAGTCIAGATYRIARPCLSDGECGMGGICSMNQEDTNEDGRGDACYLCTCDFDCSGSVDAIDVIAFLTDFGRNQFNDPCTDDIPCNGDVNCDRNVDAADVTDFLDDFGRNQFHDPCPACEVGSWCLYEGDTLLKHYSDSGYLGVTLGAYGASAFDECSSE